MKLFIISKNLEILKFTKHYTFICKLLVIKKYQTILL